MRKLLRSILTLPRCPICRERSRHMAAHIYINHFGELR